MGPDRVKLLDLLDPQLEDGAGPLIHDSPVLPEVWTEFATARGTPVCLLLTPAEGFGPHEVMLAIRRRILALPQGELAQRSTRLYYHQSHVLAEISFPIFIDAVVRLTEWWRRRIDRHLSDLIVTYRSSGEIPVDLVAAVAQPRQPTQRSAYSGDLLHLLRVASLIRLLTLGNPLPALPDHEFWREALGGFLGQISAPSPAERSGEMLVERIGLNRRVSRAVARSSRTIKADAAQRMFKVSCEELRWAVVDSGIDATHPAFQIRGEPLKTDHDSQGGWRSRVLETYDFTRLTGILREAEDAPADSPYRRIGAEAFDELHWRLASGQSFDWALVEPFLRIPHDGTYSPPLDEHGSHVAGILAADWRTTDEPGSGRSALTGVCPDLRLYDLRVLPRDGAGDEFTVLGALQFIRYMNRRSDTPRIHGVNLSLSLRHEVRSYACGRSPVCEECARLIASGVVVVVAAGNSGYSTPTAQELMEDYHSISVTDPGNSEAVITVGSTHREYPHTYGVSFFSSRGPTADGRLKPDLVAPGEGIESVVPNCDSKRMSGTSMAAPHVSGVAALLMAYHRHLIGYPSSVKQVLCRTATDLGRERSFQGAGLVDALRALQSL